jgi:hypothetical protein
MLCYQGAPVYQQNFDLGILWIPTEFVHGGVVSKERQKACYWVVSSNLLYGLPSDAFLDSGLRAKVILPSEKLNPSRAIAHIGRSIYIFRLVSDDDYIAGSPWMKYSEAIGSLRIATDEEVMKVTVHEGGPEAHGFAFSRLRYSHVP